MALDLSESRVSQMHSSVVACLQAQTQFRSSSPAASARGTELEEPFGTEVYLMDMEPYTQFGSHRLIHDLLGLERRTAPVAAARSMP